MQVSDKFRAFASFAQTYFEVKPRRSVQSSRISASSRLASSPEFTAAAACSYYSDIDPGPESSSVF